jgi:hypothetical protein
MLTGSLRFVISEFEYRNRGGLPVGMRDLLKLRHAIDAPTHFFKFQDAAINITWLHIAGSIPRGKLSYPSSHLRWEAATLTPILTIRTRTSHLVQNGSRVSLGTVLATSPVVTSQTSISLQSSSPIDWTIPATSNSRDGAPQE